MSRKSFTPAFKQECIELVIRQARGIKLNKQVKQAAIVMDVCPHCSVGCVSIVGNKKG